MVDQIRVIRDGATKSVPASELGSPAALDILARASQRARTNNYLDLPVYGAAGSPTAGETVTLSTNIDPVSGTAAAQTRFYNVTDADQSYYQATGGNPTGPIGNPASIQFPVSAPATNGFSGRIAWAMHFVTDAPNISIRLVLIANTKFQILVDGQRVNDPTVIPNVASSGTYVRLEFAGRSAKGRVITVLCEKISGLMRVAVPQPYSIWRPTPLDAARGFVLGSSSTAAPSANVDADDTDSFAHLNYASRMMTYLGIYDRNNLGVSGTGHSVDGVNGKRFNDETRMDDVRALLARGPLHFAAVQSSINDRDSAIADVSANVLLTYQKLRALLPSVPLFFFGAFPGNTGPSPDLLAVEQAVAAMVASQRASDKLLAFIPVSTATPQPRIFGTGTAAAAGTGTGAGNADVYVKGDGTHPTWGANGGHEKFARIVTEGIRDAITTMRG